MIDWKYFAERAQIKAGAARENINLCLAFTFRSSKHLGKWARQEKRYKKLTEYCVLKSTSEN